MGALLIVIGLIFIVAPLAIYIDATSNKIGKIESENGFLNLHAGGWAACALIPVPIVPWIAVIGYLIKRKQLIQKAKTHPVELSTKHRISRVFLIALLQLIFQYLIYT